MFDIEGGGGNSSLVVVFGLFFLSISICVLFFSFFCIGVSTGCACFSSSLAHRSTTPERFCSLTLLNTVSTSSYCPK